MDSLALLTSSPSFLLRSFPFSFRTSKYFSTWTQGRDGHQPEVQAALELLQALSPGMRLSAQLVFHQKCHLWEILFGTDEISGKAEAGSSKGQVEWSFVAEEGKVAGVYLNILFKTRPRCTGKPLSLSLRRSAQRGHISPKVSRNRRNNKIPWILKCLFWFFRQFWPRQLIFSRDWWKTVTNTQGVPNALLKCTFVAPLYKLKL